MLSTERRASPRIRPGRLIRFTILENSLVNSGTLLDVSEHGAGVVVDTALPPATTLHMELDGHLMVGTVLYCVAAADEKFRLGLHLVNHLSNSDWRQLLEKWRTPV